jgi:pyridoxal 5'-phosphate synthase pdxS subunit
MIRMKGNAGTGNVVEAVQHTRHVFKEIRRLQTLRDDEVYSFAK